MLALCYNEAMKALQALATARLVALYGQELSEGHAHAVGPLVRSAITATIDLGIAEEGLEALCKALLKEEGGWKYNGHVRRLRQKQRNITHGGKNGRKS